MLQIDDMIIAIHKTDRTLHKLHVEKVNKNHVVLSNGKKISRNNLDRDQYWEIPKTGKQQYMYHEPTDDLLDKYEEQQSRRVSLWERLSKFDAGEFFSAPKTVLLFALALLLGQSFHSCHALLELAGTMHPVANWTFSIITAIFLDGILLFHIARGNVFYSWVAFFTCFLLNTFSYHIGTEYWTYESWFSFVPAFAIPFFLHSIGVTLKADSNGK